MGERVIELVETERRPRIRVDGVGLGVGMPNEEAARQTSVTSPGRDHERQENQQDRSKKYRSLLAASSPSTNHRECGKLAEPRFSIGQFLQGLESRGDVLANELCRQVLGGEFDEVLSPISFDGHRW